MEGDSEDGMTDGENMDGTDDMESQAGGEGSASENNSKVNQTGIRPLRSPKKVVLVNLKQMTNPNGNPTGQSGDDNTNNNPDKEGSAKPDDQHDRNIFEKLLDRLRDNQQKTNRRTTKVQNKNR